MKGYHDPSGADPNTAARGTPHPSFGRRERNPAKGCSMTGAPPRGGSSAALSDPVWGPGGRALLSDGLLSLVLKLGPSRSSRLITGLRAVALGVFTAEKEEGLAIRLCLSTCRSLAHRALHEGVEAILCVIGRWTDQARVLHLNGSHNPSAIPVLRRMSPKTRGDRDTVVAQFSYAKRALPHAGERKVRESLALHKERLTTPLVTPPEHIENFRSFCRLWASRNLDENPKPLGVVGLSHSACETHTVRNGGHMSRCREILEEVNSTDYKAPPPRPPGLLAQEWWDGWAKERLLTYSREKYTTLGHVPRGTATIIYERGLKVRIVTKLETEACLLGHQARLRLVRAMRTLPEISALSGDHKEFLRAFSNQSGWILSSDLTAASDLLPLDLVQAGIDGLEASGRLLPDEVLGLRVCGGTFDLSWGKLGRGQLKTGILMGAPPTWCLLSLVHLYWLDAARHAYPGSRRLLPARIFGDDLVAAMDRKQKEAYEESLAACHGLLSKGKHSFHRTHGVFLERLFVAERHIRTQTLSGEGSVRIDPPIVVKVDVIKTLNLLRTLPLRPLVVLQTSVAAGRRHVSKGTLPTPLAVGGISDGLMRADFPPELIRRCQWALWPGLSKYFRTLGIPPYLPTLLGGGGLISPEGWDLGIHKFSRLVRASVTALVTGNGVGSFVPLARIPPPLVQMALEEADALAPAHPHRVSHKQPKLWLGKIPWHDMGTLADFRITAAMVAQEGYLLQMPLECLGRPLNLTVSRWKDQVWKQRSKLASQSWWAASRRARFSIARAVRKCEQWPHLWLPGSPDPDHPGVFGIPMYIDSKL